MDTLEVNYQHQQPMSLMTIDASNLRRSAGSGAADDNLLTLRILEASERKMQLIRKLLSPEEFNSLATSSGILHNDMEAVQSSEKLSNRDQTTSMPVTQLLSRKLIEEDSAHVLSAYEMSKSDTNLPISSGRGVESSNEVQGRLAQKKEALEFFFEDPDEGTKHDAPVSMELRAPHNLADQRDDSNPNVNLLTETNSSWLSDFADLFWSITDLFGIVQTYSELTDAERRFIDRHDKLNTLPYSKRRNLLAMFQRLERENSRVLIDGQPDMKIAFQGQPTSDLYMVDVSTSIQNNKTYSRKAQQFSVSGCYGHDLLRYHPLADRLLGSRTITLAEADQKNPICLLSAIVFSQTTGLHLLDNPERRLARLTNDIEPEFLARLLDKNRISSGFCLDPFVDKLTERKSTELRNTTGRPKVSPQRKSLRYILIAKRWVNNLNRLVHLSERENAHTFGPNSSETLKAKLDMLVFNKSASGQRSGRLARRPGELTADAFIEQIRLQATDWIKQFESNLVETLRWDMEMRQVRGARGDQGIVNMSQLLREPQLKPLIIDFPNLVGAARRLIPQPNACRPLMPKRRQAIRSRWHALAASVTGLDSSKQVGLENGSTEVVSNWMLASKPASSLPLRLVVTVQQATNIPMRIVQANQSSLVQRPTSPSFEPMSRSPISFIGPRRPMSPMGITSYLSPPTTYIEAVFQRRQQTSSLVSGKSPAWNETLFFPVATSKRPDLESDPQPTKSELIDEHLQLNLYDYNCYTVQDSVGTPEASTLPIDQLGEPLSSQSRVSQASRHAASRQRIERHLLGSLRIPLTTIMTNGRIEGSFALSQPLFLDNYQFDTDSDQMGTQSQLLASSSEQQEIYISLFITLDPPISMGLNFHLPVECQEGERVLEYARLWEQILLRRQQQVQQGTRANRSTGQPKTRAFQLTRVRHIRALVLRSDAKYCVVSRLLGALKPAEELLLTATTEVHSTAYDGRQSARDQMQRLARFVALLSPIKYGLFQMRLLASNLWFDSSELINRCLGGPEERAVLLCNYFLHLGKCSAIIMGDAVPDGRCVWVIVFREERRFVDDQLQLQVGDLLNTIGHLGSSEGAERATSSESRRRPIVNASNFLTLLPIIINHSTVELWDASSGKCFSPRDQMPLISVGSIATCENVYANLQATDELSQTNFDIRLYNNWFPLFESSTSGTSATQNSSSTAHHHTRVKKNLSQLNWRRQTIYLENMRCSLGKLNVAQSPPNDFGWLDYGKFSDEQSQQLKATVEKVIKTNLLAWRPGRPTYFNRTLSRLLADKLALFERESSCEHPSAEQPRVAHGKEPRWRQELANTIRNEILAAHLVAPANSSRQIISCPLNLTYTSMRAILDSLYASGVHNADLMLVADSSQNRLNSASSTQFLVACHIEPLPAYVMSIWLYVAAIVTDSTGQRVSTPVNQPQQQQQFLAP